MDTRLLTYFQAIIEEGSISRAAARLHMTQPPLSASLHQLENQLTVQLVKRTPRGVVPTAAGQELARFAYQVLDSMGRMQDHLVKIHQGGAGQLRIATVTPYLWGPLTELIATLTSSTPDIDVTVSAPAPLEVLNAVRSQTVDLGAIAVANMSDLREKYGHEIDIIHAHTFSLVAALPSTYAGLQTPIDIRELDSIPWLMAQPTLGVRSLPELVRQTWLENGITPSRERSVESVATAMPMVGADLGVTLVPHSTQNAFSKNVIFREVRQELPKLEITLIRSRDFQPSAVTRRFIDMATALG